MALTRWQGIALGCGAAFALGLPAVLLSLGSGAPVGMSTAPVRTVVPPPVPALAAIYGRALFAAAEGAGDAAPADAPALVGIAGRIDRDAVALVRLADGRSRSLKPGESVDGWRLESLAIDAAFFTRGPARVRVAMVSEAGASEAGASEAGEPGETPPGDPPPQ